MTSYTFADPPPYEHQRDILKRIIETRGKCAILADPGTGKTRTVIDYAGMLATKTQSEVRVLVIPPLAAIDGWVEQTLEYLPEGIGVWAEALGGSIVKRAEALRSRGPDTGGLRLTGFQRAEVLAIRNADGSQGDPRQGPAGVTDGGPSVVVLSTNLDGFASRRAVTPGGTVTAADRMVEGVKGFAPDIIVIDESHRIKGHSSNTSKAIARLTRLAPRRLLLTGTVMPHSPLDVYAQWRFLDPEVFGTRLADGTTKPWAFHRFRNEYAVMGGYLGKEVKGFRNLDDLQDRMALNSVVVRKSDALDLPPTSDARISVSLSPRERTAYAQMKEDLVARVEDGALTSAPNVLAQLMRLRQITSGILHDDVTGEAIDLGSSKVRAIASHVNDTLAGEDRVVVFCHFRDEIAKVAEAVAATGTLVETITGDTHPTERTAIRKRFGAKEVSKRHDGRMVLVAQVRTLSLAVNELVTASHAVYGSLSERRDDYVQSRDRLDRIGQENPVTFWHAVAPGTVDDIILTAHRDRTDLEDAVLRHLKSGD